MLLPHPAYILTTVDRTARWAEVNPLKNTTTADCLAALSVTAASKERSKPALQDCNGLFTYSGSY
jgi:hypothetical protein